MAKLTRNLGLQQAVGGVAAVVVEFTFTYELSRQVELPQFGRGLVGEGEQPFVARGEWSAAESAVVGGSNVVITPCGCCTQSLYNRIGGVYLQRVAVAFSL